MIISVTQSVFVYILGGFYLNQSGKNIVYKGVILSFNLVWIVIFAVFMGHMPKYMADESNLFWKRGMFNACSEEAVEDGCEDFFRNAKVDQGLNYHRLILVSNADYIKAMVFFIYIQYIYGNAHYIGNNRGKSGS